jgi:cytochrome P450
MRCRVRPEDTQLLDIIHYDTSRTVMPLPPKFDPLDPAVLRDPYPTYEMLRRRGELARGGPAQWVVSRYSDIAALVNDPRLGSEVPLEYHEFSVGKGATAEFRQRIILDRDPPAHTRLRAMMAKSFSPSLMRRMQERIGQLVDSLLEPALARGAFDAVSDLAFPLPVMVLCELLGVPASDRDLVKPRAIELSKAFSLFLPDSERANVDAAVTWLRQYMHELLVERRERPGTDLLSHMLAVEAEGNSISYEEIVDNSVFLFFAGFETTTNMISNGFSCLLEHPSQLARLRAEPSLVPTAIEEILRYEAPVQVKGRIARQDLEIAGTRVKQGRIVVLLLGSANRDEREFPEPDRFDVGRRPNRHVSFGGGIHRCLGAALARVEGTALFSRLLERSAHLELAAEPVRRSSPSFRGHARVPILIRAA